MTDSFFNKVVTNPAFQLDSMLDLNRNITKYVITYSSVQPLLKSDANRPFLN